MLTIFGFHTDDNLYRKHAQILQRSAEKFDINVHFSEFSKDDWQKIIAFKPVFIAQMRRKLEGPILFVDADAIILKDIRPFFESIQEDIAVHYINGNRLISSTILINDTPNARLLINEWERRQLEQPERWDQVVLQELIDEWVEEKKVTLNKLPPNYTFIFDTSRRTYGDSVEPIIEQLQASRDKRWIDKYRSRNRFHQWLMRIPYLLKSTRKIVSRHNVVNNRAEKLGIDVRISIDDLI
ncbi:glycosyltransferase family 77 protein [Acinetobacter suaedae]|uniref:Glycosyltransferase family 77 protein n=1 Tax=Acinetobacter suaedae TaxID=2609668 RepID=A0A5P1UQM0_9GAMM|nr:putative nucleotide-diphospho-sugar transferase [Acinetobacter sp. C16S1]QER38698.1 glycosyltransferase family 77 protein [Acinetobacter sp. C16S1]